MVVSVASPVNKLIVKSVFLAILLTVLNAIRDTTLTPLLTLASNVQATRPVFSVNLLYHLNVLSVAPIKASIISLTNVSLAQVGVQSAILRFVMSPNLPVVTLSTMQMASRCLRPVTLNAKLVQGVSPLTVWFAVMVTTLYNQAQRVALSITVTHVHNHASRVLGPITVIAQPVTLAFTREVFLFLLAVLAIALVSLAQAALRLLH